jgi:SAM-dependent methyltransferase
LVHDELRKTERGFWDGTHSSRVRLRLPSPLNVGVANIIRLLRPHVRAGDKVLEIGFAPGKQLAHLARAWGARVSGLDYSPPGIAQARELFAHLGLDGDLRCEDLFAPSFPDQSFDVVYSLGLIEHFDNPAVAVERHYRFVKPGGRLVIAIPNYGGLYGRTQGIMDRANLDIHNLEIMNLDAMRRLADELDCAQLDAYPFGRFSPWLISFETRMPRLLALGIASAGNVLGLAQPVDIGPLCPLLVLELTRSS